MAAILSGRYVGTPPRPGNRFGFSPPVTLINTKEAAYRKLKELDCDDLIEFHFLGKTDENLRDIGVHHGAYDRENFADLVREIQPSFAAVFSIWAETYSHTLTEAWGVGLPVLGSNLGAVGERIAKHGGGWVVETTDPAGTIALIRTIATGNGVYKKAVSEVERIQFQTVQEMADSYRALYEEVLTNHFLVDALHVGCLVPPGDRGSTFVRVELPLTHETMRERLLAVRLPAAEAGACVDKWIDRLGLHTLFLQREALDKNTAVAVIETCRARNVRVVFEIDDNLLELADSHADYALTNHELRRFVILRKTPIKSSSARQTSWRFFARSTNAFPSSETQLTSGFGSPLCAFRNARLKPVPSLPATWGRRLIASTWK